MTRASILLAVCLCLAATGAEAKKITLDPPADIPANLAPPARARLTPLQAQLMAEFGSTQAQIDAQAAKCGSVDADSPLVQTCITEQKTVLAAVAKYRSDAKDFSAAVDSAKAAPAQSGDPMVVDGRDVPTGLPPAIERAIAQAYPNASPDVIKRVQRGFEAVLKGDWVLAKALFGDALNHDPGNHGLMELAALSEYSVRRQSGMPEKAAPPASPSNLDKAFDQIYLQDKDADRAFDQIYNSYPPPAGKPPAPSTMQRLIELLKNGPPKHKVEPGPHVVAKRG